MVLTAPPTATDTPEFKHIGRPLKRPDALERLTGQLRYVADLAIPGALHARFVRSPYAAARIVAVHKEAALRVSGVTHVLVASDLPVADLQSAVDSGRLLIAHERVFHAGQAVAVVLAESPLAAEDGALAVEVDYEPLTVVVDPAISLRDDAPPVRAPRDVDETELAQHGAAIRSGAGPIARKGPNVTNQVNLKRGDVEVGFRDSDVVVERTMRTSSVIQGYLEPQACVAMVDALGTVVIYASTQAMFGARTETAKMLGVPDHQVTVKPLAVGGGFGGKFIYLEPTVAALAMAVHRPVVATFSRTDDFMAVGPTPDTEMRVKVGATNEGRLTTVDATLRFNAGSRAGTPLGLAGMMLGSTYRWDNVAITGSEVLTNRPATAAYRGPGAPQAAFGIEVVVDDVARALNIDPLEFRLANAVSPGDPTADGAKWPSMGMRQCLERARAPYLAERAAAGPNEGVGIAVGGWFGGLEPASAYCRLNSDGTLQVSVAAVDLTGTNTTFSIIAAEAFGLESPGQVRVTTVDTDGAPYAGATGGSKVTYTVGPAVEKAAREARDQVLRIAAAELEAGVEDLEIVDGRVQVRGIPIKSRTLRQIYQLSASFGAKYEPVVASGRSAQNMRAPGMAVHIVRVHVDPETGRVTPLRFIAVQDVGRAINPATVDEQMHGGAIQGIGWGLFEGVVHDDQGTPLTASFMDYVLPKATHSPEVVAVQVEVPSLIGPFGAKGVGEPAVVPSAAALSNAIRDACGVRVTELPMTSERVQAALAASEIQ